MLAFVLMVYACPMLIDESCEWRPLDQGRYVFVSEEACQERVRRPPGPGKFKCALRWVERQ